MFFIDEILSLVFLYARPFIKWFLHRFTNLCELQRICYGTQSGTKRTKLVEKSLGQSKQPEIKQLLKELDEMVEFCCEEDVRQFPFRAAKVVQRSKKIKSHIHPDFSPLFGECVLHIWSYKHMAVEVEKLRAESYDSNNLSHEDKLLELWYNLMPETPLSGRVSSQWQDIGFQGDDPKTDFRGMGLLGLENLLYFSKQYKDAAHHVLLHSMHPVVGYTFAIVGINLTALACRLVQSGDAKTHFYNVAQSSKQALSLREFHNFYCFLVFEFDRFWLDSSPTSIMDFREIYQQFEIVLLEALHKETTIFKTNLVVEDI